MKRSLPAIAALLTAGVLLLPGCGLGKKKSAERNPATKPAKHEENNEVDFQAFVARLRKAVATRDMQTIASMMTPDFGYSLNPERSGPGVFQYWDENNIWPELENTGAGALRIQAVAKVWRHHAGDGLHVARRHCLA